MKIGRLSDELKDYQDNLRLLQQHYQDIQLIIAQSSNVVQITDKARVTSNIAPVTATVMLQINQLPSTRSNDPSALLQNENLEPTYDFMLQSPTLLDEAINKSGVGITAADLAPRVTIDQIPGTQALMLSVWSTDADSAVKITDAVAHALAVQTQALQAKPYLDQQVALQKQMENLIAKIEQTRASIIETTTTKVQLEQELSQFESALGELRENNRALLQDHDKMLLAEASSVDAVLISESAKEPTNPVDRRIINTILGMMVGGMAGVGMAFLIEYVEDKVRTREDTYRTLGIYPITTISRLLSRSNKVLDEWSPGTRAAEEFRTLGTKIRLVCNDSSCRTVCVTSPSQSEGKTFVLANLAIALARTGMNVIAVDADLRHPQLHVAFGIEQGEGLSNFLANKNGSCETGVKLTEVKGVQVVSSGEITEDPIGLLSSPKFKNLLEEMSNKADLVLVDCPPVLPVADASVLASNVDGVLLILRANQTNNRAAKDAVENLAKANARFVGVVLNAVAVSKDQYTRYYSRIGKNVKFLTPAFRQAQNLVGAIQKKFFQAH